MVVTNALGVAFVATLVAASDRGATFAFPEDGATNVLAWSQLSAPSRAAVCKAAGFAMVPPALAATFHQAQRELRRLDALSADARIEPALAAQRRISVQAAFAGKCRAQNLADDDIDRLWRRLLRK